MYSFYTTVHKGSVDVSCAMTADNEIKSVQLIHESGIVEDLEIQYEGQARWEDMKTVSFQQSHINDKAALRIHAEDGVANQDHCYYAGLLLHCTASDSRSPWVNFLTNTDNWYSQDGKELCSNNSAAFLHFHYDVTNQLTSQGANHIWVENEQVVDLVGTPWNDFTVVAGKRAIYVMLDDSCC